MANKARGFVSIDLPGGTYDLGLSLDTLAGLEDEFKVETFEDAFKIAGKNARETRKFFTCIFKGSGYDLTDGKVSRDIGSMIIPDASKLLNDLMVLGGLRTAATEGAQDPLEVVDPAPIDGGSG